MIYAPVVIWTLNRYEHFKCCIESLKKNKYAINTELYISLDYPPSERYQEGYEKIKDYLERGISGFKKVNIYKQDVNLGPINNFMFIINKAYEKHDRIIIMEDDNEVSSCFLEFMNFMLKRYENDNSIFAINGYSYPIEWEDDGKDIVKIDNMFSAWGCAWWRFKYLELLKEIKAESVERLVKNVGQMFKVFKNSPICFGNLISSYLNENGIMCDKNGNFIPIDSTVVVYLITHDKYVIMPKISQVINHGMDGSGVNCSKSEGQENESRKTIDKWGREIFLIENEDIEVNKKNHDKLVRMFSYSLRNFCSCWVQYVLYRCHLKSNRKFPGR